MVDRAVAALAEEILCQYDAELQRHCQRVEIIGIEALASDTTYRIKIVYHYSHNEESGHVHIETHLSQQFGEPMEVPDDDTVIQPADPPVVSQVDPTPSSTNGLQLRDPAIEYDGESGLVTLSIDVTRQVPLPWGIMIRFCCGGRDYELQVRIM